MVKARRDITTPSVLQIIKAGVQLKCPRCRRGALFHGMFRMHSECQVCGLGFEREQGFFVGAIYLNYAATVMIVLPGYFVVDYLTGMSVTRQLLIWGVLTVIFPFLFFRHSRSLWLSLAYLLDRGERMPQGSRKKKIL